jgi:hypothetical protein
VRRLFFCVTLAALVALPAVGSAAPVTFSASGPDATDIQATVDAFRTAVGSPNNGNAPGQVSGRREINWDGGGGVSATTISSTPFNGFQNIRGALFTTPGASFAQATPTGLANDLGFTNANYLTAFRAFSPLRLFTPVGSNITDVTFFIPGTNGGAPTVTRSFGAVFSDVDLANTTSLQYFDRNGLSLGTFFVPASPGIGTFSFLGVNFTTEQIGRVRITTGTTPLSATAVDGPGVDLVVMDDFIYGEPLTVPEPASMTLCLLGLGVTGLEAWRRRRRGKLVA